MLCKCVENRVVLLIVSRDIIRSVTDSIDEKIAKYATLKYTTESSKIVRDSQEAFRKSTNEAAARGALLTGHRIQGIISNAAELIKSLVMLRAQAVMEAHEIYGVPLPDSIVEEAKQAIRTKVATTAASLAMNPQIMAFNQQIPIEQREQEIRGHLEVMTSGLIAELMYELERRRVIPQMKRESGAVTTNNIFHLYGHASKVNINSTDDSVTMVNVNQEELFTQLRSIVAKGAVEADQEEILKRLDELQSANKHTVWERFTSFVSVADVIIRDLGPYIPALTEWAHKMAG